MLSRLALRIAFVTRVLTLALALATPAHAAWPGYGGNAQHTALSPVPTQPLQAIHWQTPVDLQPQYSGSVLFIHYGSPVVTEGNTVIFPVKTGATGGFRFEARNGGDGALRWSLATDYVLPPHNWTPSVGSTITPQGRYWFPGAGGTLFYTDALDAAGAHTATRVAFYGDGAYAINQAGMDAGLFVCTPLTSDAQGRIYFGVRTVSGNPLAITSGLVRIDPNGPMLFFSPAAATAGTVTDVSMNCAPALSADEQTVYVACRTAGTSAPAFLMAIDAATLTLNASRLLVDPVTAQPARVTFDGTASPMVAPDGRVYFGVLENPFGTNAARGWLLQFDGTTLAPSGAPAAFGWDDTPSLVPLAAVPNYHGTAPYLLMIKYNYYAGFGDGVNKIAVVDPDLTQIDTHSGATVMREFRTIAGITPDPGAGPGFPNAVKEWCINTAAIDAFSGSVLAGSEDGVLYRWDLATNDLSEAVVLTPGIGEAYTPTLTGPDGQVYAINNATLFAVGGSSVGVPPRPVLTGVTLARPQPNPSSAATTLHFALSQSQVVTLEVIDLAGQRVATLWSGEAAAGEHAVRWDGRDASGAMRPAGVYFVRLVADGATHLQKLVRVR